jgi:hypothetical protein
MNKEYIHIVEISPSDFGADKHQRRYGAVMRIRVSESISIPVLTRGADGLAILNINAELSFEDIEGFVGENFKPGERDLAFSLWADDETNRVFTPIEGTTDFFIDLR